MARDDKLGAPLANPVQADEASDLFASIYGFTEGFETRDLKEARALQKEMA
jgi:hypothetical protein